MVTLALILSHKIKQFTNLRHFWESIYEYVESVFRTCSKTKVPSGTEHTQAFSGFGIASRNHN